MTKPEPTDVVERTKQAKVNRSRLGYFIDGDVYFFIEQLESQREEIELLKEKLDKVAIINRNTILRRTERAESAEAQLAIAREALESIVKVDKTIYDHHEPRPDGLLPKDDDPPGTCWRTPKSIATAALTKLQRKGEG